ncbi:MAG: hypothetical protein ACKVP4_14530 [Hyphomicrobium sp.]
MTPATATNAVAGRVTLNGEMNYEAIRQLKIDSTVTVVQSPGGTGAAAMALGRVSRLIIDGPCNSACAWAFIRNPHACFTARSSFGFHAAHDPGTRTRLPTATVYWLEQVKPAGLRSRLAPLKTSSKLVRLTAGDMRRYYGERFCSASN